MKMNLILRDIDSHIVDKIDNLAKQKKISRNEFLKQKVDEFAFEKEANELEYNYQKLQKEIIENIRSVSYTHLDVYKRQALDTLSNVFNGQLSDSELSSIPKLEQGNCILSINGFGNISFNIEASSEELELFKGGA